MGNCSVGNVVNRDVEGGLVEEGSGGGDDFFDGFSDSLLSCVLSFIGCNEGYVRCVCRRWKKCKMGVERLEFRKGVSEDMVRVVDEEIILGRVGEIVLVNCCVDWLSGRVGVGVGVVGKMSGLKRVRLKECWANTREMRELMSGLSRMSGFEELSLDSVFGLDCGMMRELNWENLRVLRLRLCPMIRRSTIECLVNLEKLVCDCVVFSDMDFVERMGNLRVLFLSTWSHGVENVFDLGWICYIGKLEVLKLFGGKVGAKVGDKVGARAVISYYKSYNINHF